MRGATGGSGQGPFGCAAWAQAAALGWGISTLVLAAACGEDARAPLLADQTGAPIAGCEDFGYRPCDILDSDCQDELFALMSCVRKEAPDANDIPPVLLMNEAEAVAAVSAASEGAGPEVVAEDFASEVRGLEMLGLLDAGLIESEADIVDVTIDSVVAFYLIPTREIVIIDRGDPVDDLGANATLAHELVHAMQDARHGLARFSGANFLDSDAALAATSIIEGEAMLYQLLLMIAYDGVEIGSVNLPMMFDSLADFGRDTMLDAGSPMITASGIFPYTHGARYAGAHWLRGQEAAIDLLYDEPPTSSLEVMLGGRTVAPVQIRSFDVAPEPLAGYVEVADDVAGAWVTFALLAGLAPAPRDAPAIESLSEGWRGDRLWIYRADDGAGSVAALWTLSWDTADTAAEVARQLAAWAPEGVTLDVSVVRDSVRVVAVENAADLDGWVARLASALGE